MCVKSFLFNNKHYTVTVKNKHHSFIKLFKTFSRFPLTCVGIHFKTIFRNAMLPAPVHITHWLHNELQLTCIKYK